MRTAILDGMIQFLSTPSARRATCRCAGKRTAIGYFYPRPPRGGRHGSPMGWDRFGDFYPRPPRGGRRYTSASHWRDIDISIHALREEGDAVTK